MFSWACHNLTSGQRGRESWHIYTISKQTVNWRVTFFFFFLEKRCSITLTNHEAEPKQQEEEVTFLSWVKLVGLLPVTVKQRRGSRRCAHSNMAKTAAIGSLKSHLSENGPKCEYIKKNGFHNKREVCRWAAGFIWFNLSWANYFLNLLWDPCVKCFTTFLKRYCWICTYVVFIRDQYLKPPLWRRQTPWHTPAAHL